MSSWTQVYISGLSKSINPSDEEIEDYLNKCYCLDGGGNDNHNNDDDDDDDGGSAEHVNSNDQDGIISSNSSKNLMWAGPGSTLIKRDDNGCCRGFAFITFYSMDGALLAIDRINNDSQSSSSSDATASSNTSNNMRLRAELSNPTTSKKKGGKKKNDGGENLTDLRLRRQRKQPVRKHPVITSSDGKRTNLGNKTK